MDQMNATLRDMQNTIKTEGAKESLVHHAFAPGSQIDLAALQSQLAKSVLAKQQSFSIKKAASPSRVGTGLPGFNGEEEDDDLSLDGPGGKQLLARQASQSRGFNPNKPERQPSFRGTGGKLGGALLQVGSAPGSRSGTPPGSTPSTPKGGRKNINGAAADSSNELLGNNFSKPKKSALEILEAEALAAAAEKEALEAALKAAVVVEEFLPPEVTAMWGSQLGTVTTTTASIKIKCSNAGTIVAVLLPAPSVNSAGKDLFPPPSAIDLLDLDALYDVCPYVMQTVVRDLDISEVGQEVELTFSPLKPNEIYRIYTHIECDGAAPLVKVLFTPRNTALTTNPPSHNPS